MSLIIPQHISRHAFISIPIFLPTYIVFKSLKYEYANILIVLLITSFLNWNKIHRASYIKSFDILISVTTLSIITFYSSNRFNYPCWLLWRTTAIVMVSSFFTNEYLFYYQVLKICKKHNSTCCTKFHYFTLLWTKPNTHERDCAYYRNVYTHMFFIHLLPGVISIFCALHSHYKPNINEPTINKTMINQIK